MSRTNHPLLFQVQRMAIALAESSAISTTLEIQLSQAQRRIQELELEVHDLQHSADTLRDDVAAMVLQACMATRRRRRQ